MTIRELISATGATFTGSEDILDKTPTTIETDSRAIQPGSLFFAIRGEKTDGHKYIPDVLAKGALAVISEEKGAEGEPRILVDNTIEAMQQAAKYRRNHLDIPIIGVTGSVGKTTAKEMISASLQGKYSVYKTPGSLNGQIGLPVSLVGMQENYQAAVIEMGISHFGEMTRLTEIVHPDVAVFTNIGDAHLEFLHSRDGVLQAKSEILLGMKPNSYVVVNGDDELLNKASFEGFRKITFGLGEHCDYRALNVANENGAFSCQVQTPKELMDISLSAYGQYLVYSVAAAVAVSDLLGLNASEIQKGLQDYKALTHRSQILQCNGYTVIDDCYNANPTSNKAAIDSMLQFPGRKLAVLGDMKEMGKCSEEVHRQVGAYAKEAGVDLLFTFGDEAKFISEAFEADSRHFSSKDELTNDLKKTLLKGDVVLVKASHSCQFETIVAEITKN